MLKILRTYSETVCISDYFADMQIRQCQHNKLNYEFTEDKVINEQFFPANCLKSPTTSLLGAKNIRFSCFRRDNETFTCRFASVQSDYKQRDFPSQIKQ